MTDATFLFDVELFSDVDSYGVNIKCHNLAEALAKAHEFCDNHMSGHAIADIWWTVDLRALRPTTYAQGFGVCDYYHTTEHMNNRLYA